MISLEGKTAIVTGASRGIGAASAKALAEVGASVLLLARSTKDIEAVAAEIREAGGTAEAMSADVASFGDMAAAVEKCHSLWGRIDILVNNAGVIDPVARIADSDADAWGTVVDINLKGVYNGLRAVLPHMEKARSGVIINLSSGAATGALEGWSHYCSTKAAVLSLTKCVHKECAEHGVRCVGLSPGTVATDMQVVIKDSGINPVSQLDPSVHIPPEWVGKTVVWLCSDEAKTFDGGDFSMKTDEGRALVGLPPL